MFKKLLICAFLMVSSVLPAESLYMSDLSNLYGDGAAGVSNAMGWDIDLAKDYGSSFGDGSGDSFANAIDIDSVGAWNKLTETSGDWSKYIKLSKDIDFYGLTVQPMTTLSTRFTGHLDGGDYCMSNFTIASVPDTYNAVALIRRMTSSATVKNLRIKNASVTGASTNETQSYTAILVGEMIYGCVVDNIVLIDCNVRQTHTQTGNIGYVGLVAAASHSTVSDVEIIRGSAKADLSAGSLNLGTVVGLQTGGESGGETGYLINCTSSAYVGDIAGASAVAVDVGGIVGVVAGGATNSNIVQNCHFRGRFNYVSANAIRGGGICGSLSGKLIDCSAEAEVRAVGNATTMRIGGIAGYWTGAVGLVDRCYYIGDIYVDGGAGACRIGGGIAEMGAGPMTDSYVIGTIYDGNADSTTLGFQTWGGMVGTASSAVITNCYAAMGPWGGASSLREGFLGYDISSDSTLNDCLWDTTVAGHATAADGTEHTTAELMTVATYAGYGFDFTLPRDWKWKSPDTYGYPSLDWE